MEDEFFLLEDDGSIDSEEEFSNLALLRIWRNTYSTRKLLGSGDNGYIQNMTDEEWEEVGRDMSNNTRLEDLSLYDGALNDHKMSFFFRGLMRSSSIRDMRLHSNGFSVAGVRSMVPFLQSANNLVSLELDDNNLQSEGFNTLLRALQNSPIEGLYCNSCGIESIEIDNEHKPKHLEELFLTDNSITDDGCRGLSKLMEGGDAVLTILSLFDNKISDEGVEILVAALQKNSSLTGLNLASNDGISDQGQIILLKLVNNICSIKATFQSNHTLMEVRVNLIYDSLNDVNNQIQRHIDMATGINAQKRMNPETAGNEKVIQTQLNSSRRAALAKLQGVRQSFYSEISPLHLPEVLALVCCYHGRGELYVALKSSIAGVISTVNRKQCLLQQRAHHEAVIAHHRTKMETIDAEIEAMEKAGGSHIGSESRSSKRRRA